MPCYTIPYFLTLTILFDFILYLRLASSVCVCVCVCVCVGCKLWCDSLFSRVCVAAVMVCSLCARRRLCCRFVVPGVWALGWVGGGGGGGVLVSMAMMS